MILIEETKLNKMEAEKRLIYYYYYIQNPKYDISNKWEEIVKALDKEEESDPSRIDFCIDDAVLEDLADRGIIEEEEVKLTKNIWKKIIHLIKKESEWERKVYNCLNDVAAAHPVVAKLIIVFLSCILLGLVEDIIYDAINQNDEKLYLSHNNQMIEISIDGSNHLVINDIDDFKIEK